MSPYPVVILEQYLSTAFEGRESAFHVKIVEVFFEANSAFCRYKPSPMPEQRVMQVVCAFSPGF